MRHVDTSAELQAALAPRYRIEREVGRGGMAVVYLAYDQRHQRFVAIKTIRPEIASAIESQRFVQEIHLTAKLQHPHILALYDSDDAGDGLLYYVTPFIEGESLRHHLDRHGPMPVPDALRIAREVADALAFAHRQQVVHRDIKPGNILLAHGHALVADFGIARALEVAAGASRSESADVVGTPAYMSPEQRLGEAVVDGRSDVYSLGCVLFEMLVGRLPFVEREGRTALERSLTEDPPAASAARPEVPHAVDRVLARALARRAANRFASAAELCDALGAALVALEAPRSPAGDRTAAETAARSRAANLGPFVARTCDRWQQVNAFDAFFRQSRATSPGRTLLCVIHGDEGQGHESLVERLVATRLAHYATEIGGEEGGTVLNLRVAWPVGADAAIGKRDLALALFREVAPGYMGDDLSTAALATLAGHALSPIVVIQHELRAGRWSSSDDALLAWYADAFWGSFTAVGRMPLFTVFLKIIYPTDGGASRVQSWLRRWRVDKRAIAERVRRILDAGRPRCAAAMLGELTPVTVEDVQSWFDHNNIYDSEHRRRELAASIFRRDHAKPLAEVELALQRIHAEFVRQTTRHQERRAW
jgi:hypothetical protein